MCGGCEQEQNSLFAIQGPNLQKNAAVRRLYQTGVPGRRNGGLRHHRKRRASEQQERLLGGVCNSFSAGPESAERASLLKLN